MDNYEAENRELLDRFAAALRDRDTSAWFDEDELLDIFDFAGDSTIIRFLKRKDK